MIYNPAEDSYLLASVLKKEIPKIILKNPYIKILEIGSGSGIQIKTLLELGIEKENIFCCDINNEAVENCNRLGVDCIQSDLFNNLHGKYDLIIFNPPYLPEDKDEPKESKLATTGGKHGGELTNRFLKRARDHLTERGIIFLLTSSLTKGIDFEGYEINLVANKKLFFEELYVWVLK